MPILPSNQAHTTRVPVACSSTRRTSHRQPTPRALPLAPTEENKSFHGFTSPPPVRAVRAVHSTSGLFLCAVVFSRSVITGIRKRQILDTDAASQPATDQATPIGSIFSACTITLTRDADAKSTPFPRIVVHSSRVYFIRFAQSVAQPTMRFRSDIDTDGAVKLTLVRRVGFPQFRLATLDTFAMADANAFPRIAFIFLVHSRNLLMDARSTFQAAFDDSLSVLVVKRGNSIVSVFKSMSRLQTPKSSRQL
ncbi:hypothetical protein R3P38DRAFT_3274347 [Favolaschia claudopus]|uniref:Uncharacterized protein n=1 Tax=Favolaschia claudopus TaxID=2862362 RepID=A0AAW0B132_9AGAR